MNPPVDQAKLPVSVQKVIARAREALKPTAILLYGSRARGAASPTSDFDFAMLGVDDNGAWTRFYNYVNHDAPTLYGIDLVRYEDTATPLRKSIDTDGRLVIEPTED